MFVFLIHSPRPCTMYDRGFFNPWNDPRARVREAQEVEKLLELFITDEEVCVPFHGPPRYETNFIDRMADALRADSCSVKVLTFDD
jgi:hypothetical protein